MTDIEKATMSYETARIANRAEWKVGSLVLVRGREARIIDVHDFGTVDVRMTETGNCYRVSGLGF